MRRGLLLSAVLAIAISSIAVAPVADAAFPGQNGKIVFHSNKDGDYDGRYAWINDKINSRIALSAVGVSGTPKAALSDGLLP